MDFEVRWTDPALADLERVVAHIAEKSPDTAQRVGATIFGHTRVLASFPNIGLARFRTDSGSVREITYKKYRIFYQTHESEKIVEILAVRHGSRRDTIDLD